MKKLLGLVLLVSMLTGCAVSLPFNNRLSYASVKDMQSVDVGAEKVKLSIVWLPTDFPSRIDIQGADGFIGGGSRTRVPTGVALSARIEEAISSFADISTSTNSKRLTITVIEAKSGFEYSAGIFNITHVIDVGTVYLKAQFDLDGVVWTQEYRAQKKDPTIGGTSQTGILESAWDDVAVQVARDVANHLKIK